MKCKYIYRYMYQVKYDLIQIYLQYKVQWVKGTRLITLYSV